MTKASIKFTRGTTVVTVEESICLFLGEAIRFVNNASVEDIIDNAPEGVEYPDSVEITVSNGFKSYTRKIEDIVYSCGRISWGYRDPEALSYFFDKL